MIAEPTAPANPKSPARKRRRTPKQYAGAKPKARRPKLDPDRVYTQAEAALACGISVSGIMRARKSGNLEGGLKVGIKVIFLGESLIAWLKAGGRTA